MTCVPPWYALAALPVVALVAFLVGGASTRTRPSQYFDPAEAADDADSDPGAHEEGRR